MPVILAPSRTLSPLTRWAAAAARLAAAALLATSLLPAAPAIAQTSAKDEPRIALIIGNGTYKESPLRNAPNDARAMTKALRDLGFTVISHENASKRTMETAIVEFGQKLTEGGIGFFYYAGHGLQVRGRNYLVPIDAQIDSEATTRVAAVDVDLLLEQMAEAKNRVNVVILDACRNNPFERRLRGASRGLAAVDAARGTLIAYATAPGSVAADGEGDNGLYTEELLGALRVPGLKVEEVFKRVRINVTGRSKGAQTPWESSSLTGDLVVNVTVVNVNTTVAAATPGAAPTADRDALFWASVKDSKDAGAYEAYLRQFPDGAFASLARRRVAELSQPSAALGLARFDGEWDVTVDCPEHKGAEGYTFRFTAQVKDGALAGQYGIAGRPSSLALTGKIQPDGNAIIDANGMTGKPRYTVSRVESGTTYSYRVDVRFDGRRASGARTKLRPCSLSFVKI